MFYKVFIVVREFIIRVKFMQRIVKENLTPCPSPNGEGRKKYPFRTEGVFRSEVKYKSF